MKPTVRMIRIGIWAAALTLLVAACVSAQMPPPPGPPGPGVPPPPGFYHSAGSNPAVQESNAVALSDEEQTAVRNAGSICHRLLRMLTPAALIVLMLSVLQTWRRYTNKMRSAHNRLEYETMQELQVLLSDEKYHQLEEKLRSSIRTA